MLFSQNLGRGHQERTMTGLHSEDHCRGGDHGLPRSDVTLQESVHPVGLPHVVTDSLQGLVLRACEAEWKIGEKGIEHLS